MHKPLNNISENSSLLNLLGAISAGFVLGVFYIIRIGMMPVMSPIDYLSILTLAITIFSFPDYLNSLVNSKKWYNSIEFLTISILLILAVSGIMLQENINWGKFIIIPIGTILFTWEVWRFSRKRTWGSLVIGVVFIIFVFALFYSQGYHSPLFAEKIIIGTAHIDILFHASINNLFSTVGYATTGLDGAPYLHYHWGSHALFAGLKEWIGINSITFYNIAYPIIFIPLFFKAFFLFTGRICLNKINQSFSLIVGFVSITLLYSIGFLGFIEAPAMPMISESFCISLVFAFLFGSVVYDYIKYSKQINVWFGFFSMIVLFLIFLFKLSTGFAVFVGISYFLLRTSPSIKSFLIIAAFTVLYAFLINTFLFTIHRIDNSISIGNQILNYWMWSLGFITYLLGIIVFMGVIIYETRKISIVLIFNAIRSHKYIEYEILAIINLAVGFGAVIVSSNAVDVYYFFAFQLFLSVTYILSLLQKGIISLNVERKTMLIIITIIISLSIISRPDIIVKSIQVVKVGKNLSNLTNDQMVLKDYILELFQLERREHKNELCIYVPQSENWYYSSDDLSFKEIFITPAISGIVSIKSIPNFLLDSGFKNFGIAYYKKGDDLDAKIRASELDFKELLIFTKRNNKLVKERFTINSKIQ